MALSGILLWPRTYKLERFHQQGYSLEVAPPSLWVTPPMQAHAQSASAVLSQVVAPQMSPMTETGLPSSVSSPQVSRTLAPLMIPHALSASALFSFRHNI
jgi:hypothetical protein